MSHPTWVRGLKRRLQHSRRRGRCVAPYVGAWIETTQKPILTYFAASHPTWVRGLKLVILLSLPVRLKVAPYVGAWIETQ